MLQLTWHFGLGVITMVESLLVWKSYNLYLFLSHVVVGYYDLNPEYWRWGCYITCKNYVVKGWFVTFGSLGSRMWIWIRIRWYDFFICKDNLSKDQLRRSTSIALSEIYNDTRQSKLWSIAENKINGRIHDRIVMTWWWWMFSSYRCQFRRSGSGK